MALEFVKLTKGDDVISQVGTFGFFKLGVESSFIEEILNDAGGYTLNITSTNYTETLNEQNGYTLEIGG